MTTAAAFPFDIPDDGWRASLDPEARITVCTLSRHTGLPKVGTTVWGEAFGLPFKATVTRSRKSDGAIWLRREADDT